MKILCSTCVFLLALTGVARAFIGIHDIDVDPPDPVAGETVTLTFHGETTCCYQPCASARVWIDHRTLLYRIVFAYAHDCFCCFPLPEDIQIGVDIVVEEAGRYQVLAWAHLERYTEVPYSTYERYFMVGEAAATSERSWAAIRKLYR